jgi:hypothetical protein
MAQTVLRPAPEGDGRPDPLSETVLTRAVSLHVADAMAWLKPRVPTLSEEEATFALCASIRRGGADGFRAGVSLKNEFSWPIDIEMVLVLRNITEKLAFALRIETAEWVLRTGMRFPAKDNQQIEWIDGSGKHRAGTVIAVDRALCAAVVQPFEGLVKAGEPRRVLCEQVFHNITTGERAVFQLDGVTMRKATIK